MNRAVGEDFLFLGENGLLQVLFPKKNMLATDFSSSAICFSKPLEDGGARVDRSLNNTHKSHKNMRTIFIASARGKIFREKQAKTGCFP